MKCGEDFYATTETNYIRKVNPQTLETLEKVPVNLLQPASVPAHERETPWVGPCGLQELMGAAPPLMPLDPELPQHST